MHIQTEPELEDLLSRPDDATADAMASLEGDLLILGAGGKMGPSLARLAQRSCERAGIRKRIVAVARFTNSSLAADLSAAGIETITCDLLDRESLSGLPDIPNVVFMAARKFGTSGEAHLTWAMNTYLPGIVAERYRHSQLVALSTGNVYPLRSVSQAGAQEMPIRGERIGALACGLSGCRRTAVASQLGDNGGRPGKRHLSAVRAPT